MRRFGSGCLIESVEGTTLPVRRGWSPFASLLWSFLLSETKGK